MRGIAATYRLAGPALQRDAPRQPGKERIDMVLRLAAIVAALHVGEFVSTAARRSIERGKSARCCLLLFWDNRVLSWRRVYSPLESTVRYIYLTYNTVLSW